MPAKKAYFITDAHLGCRAVDHPRTRERRLVRFLDTIKDKASALYMLGDMFDFWYEFKMVVPKGYTRFLGKISELTDSGVEVHFFTGNHDIWCGDYLQKECGVKLHRHPLTLEIYGKEFYLAHGDECFVPVDPKFRLLRKTFHSPLMQRLFSSLHPRWSVALGLEWARHSMKGHLNGNPPLPYMGDDKEPCMIFARRYFATHPDINFFLFGHRHCHFEKQIADHCRLVSLGDWLDTCTFLSFDGHRVVVERFVEGETLT